MDMKKIVGRCVLLSYPNFSKRFIVHTDSSKTQLVGVISQNRKPISFHSHKLTPAQINYTTTERELLFLVETFFLFFWDGFRDPIACSLLGGGIPYQNSSYKRTRLCTSLSLGFCYYIVPPLPCFLPVVCLGGFLFHPTLF